MTNTKKDFKSDILRDPSRYFREASKEVQKEVLNSVANEVQSDSVAVNVMPTYLEITDRRLNAMGVIDLKPYFARSPKKKIAKDGHWYMFIPISIKTRDMPRKQYDELRGRTMGGQSDTVSLSGIMDTRRTKSQLSSWNRNAKGTNITRTRSSGGRTTYTMFRTVNANSPANSWIIGRDKINEDNLSKTAYENARRLMDWKLKNLGG